MCKAEVAALGASEHGESSRSLRFSLVFKGIPGLCGFEVEGVGLEQPTGNRLRFSGTWLQHVGWISHAPNLNPTG